MRVVGDIHEIENVIRRFEIDIVLLSTDLQYTPHVGDIVAK